MLRQARALNTLFVNKRFVPELTDEELAGVLHVYARHRRDGATACELEPSEYKRPDEWTVDDEREWQHMVFDAVKYQEWDSVMEELEEYREDLYTWMPYWIRCELNTEDDAEEPAVVEKEKRTIDPFLLDHGTAKQRRAAIKRGI